MTDKVRKIKEWISKEQDGLMDAQGNFKSPEHEGAYHILCNLDAYIDYMQKESRKEAVVKVEQIMAEVDAKFPKFVNECKNMQEEPVSEDLDDAAKNWSEDEENTRGCDYIGEAVAETAFKAGAKWQLSNLNEYEKSRS